MNYAVPNTHADMVWSQGITGAGEIIAILKDDSLDPGNHQIQQAEPTRESEFGSWPHANMVAAEAASTNGLYKGMAPGAFVMNAGFTYYGQDLFVNGSVLPATN